MTNLGKRPCRREEGEGREKGWGERGRREWQVGVLADDSAHTHTRAYQVLAAPYQEEG